MDDRRLSVAARCFGSYPASMGQGRRAGTLAALAISMLAQPPSQASAGEAERIRVQEALELQYELGSRMPMRNAPWVGTHNSFNSVAEMGPTLSVQDSNQRIDIPSQLDAGIRSLELDVHRFPDVQGADLRVCHARGHSEAHFGCTIEKPLTDVLAEIAEWLRAPGNREQVLLLYVEDHMDDETGYGDGAAAVTDHLGNLLYRPAPGGCSELPQDLTRNEIRAAGKQVVIVSDCGVGTAWPAVAFHWDSHVESRPFDYEPFPACGPDYDRATYDSVLVRYYEDSTQLTATAGTPDDGITPATATEMARCGVDLIGLDQVTGPDDPRFAALVWSWAPDSPAAPAAAVRPRCAAQVVGPTLPFGGWRDQACHRLRRAACRRGGEWLVPKAHASQADARGVCRRRDARLGVPRTGYQAQRLRRAMETAGAARAWLALRRDASGWR